MTIREAIECLGGDVQSSIYNRYGALASNIPDGWFIKAYRIWQSGDNWLFADHRADSNVAWNNPGFTKGNEKPMLIVSREPYIDSVDLGIES